MYDFLIEQVFNQPQLVQASRLDAIGSFLLSRQGMDLDINSQLDLQNQPEPQAFAVPDSAIFQDGGYYTDGGIAIVNMIGTMVHRGGGIQALSGLTSYHAIGRVFNRAMNDPSVTAILLNTDTPGGSVNGAFDLADKVLSARGVKPVFTLAADKMASAGYLIGSGADRIYTTQTGQLGSIGVVMKHLDVSESNKKKGIKPTYIYAGESKIDGNPDEPLSDLVKSKFQSEINNLFEMFVSSVETRRDMSREEIIGTRAAVFMGEEAVNVGLADDVITGEELLETMKIKYGVSSSRVFTSTTLETQTMSETEQPLDDAALTGDTSSAAGENQEAVDVDAIRTEARAETRTEERQRFSAIMNSEHAEGRTHAAVALSTDSDMSAESVIATLQKLPMDTKGLSKLDLAMGITEQPGISASDESTEQLTEAQSIVRDYKTATGNKG